jgi:hypothetical protein
MKIGSVEWEPLGFLHEDIRNTRFLITILNDLWLMLVVIGVFFLIIKGVAVDAVLFGAINLVVGYLIGRGQSAAGMYFNSRKDGKSEAELNNEPVAIRSKSLEAAEMAPAAVVEPPNVTEETKTEGAS